MSSVRKIAPNDRMEKDPTPGIVREEAFSTRRMWAGIARTEAGVTSGWHHHGDNDTAVYVLAGQLRVDFGPGGGDAVEAREGDFVEIPANAVHRESNPSGEESRLIVVRGGSGGPPTFNVDGPQS